MSLSPTSFEILSDLLALRLESFLVTTNEEARELRQLRACQQELCNLQTLARRLVRDMAAPGATEEAAETRATKGKISRRLQRLARSLQQQDESARAAAV